MERVRLSKLMTERGLCSRREADELIAKGEVSVNGETMDVLGTKVPRDCEITLSRAGEARARSKVTVLLNKPVGYLSVSGGQAAARSKRYPSAISLIVPGRRMAGDRSGIVYSRVHLTGLAPAGRLDIDSQGLLVLTQDGRVAAQLIRPESRVEKEYLVRIRGGEINETLLRRLRFGMTLDGRKLKRATVEPLNREQLRFVLTEGRKRQIRRMCDQVGLEVTGLKRVRIGDVRLGGLREGQWRYLSHRESF